MIKNGQIEDIDPLYYAYMAGNIVLYILGCFVQYRHKRLNPEKHQYEERMRHHYQRIRK